MKITSALIDKLLRLRGGEQIPASSLRGEWVEELLRSGVLISKSYGSKRALLASSPSEIESALASIDERFADLDKMKAILDGDVSRADQAAESGNSKLTSVRSCPGFLVNSYEPIACKLNGHELTVCPQEGSMLFISDWHTFSIPDNVIVVGIENMENFRMIRHQRQFFEKEISASYPLLFVSRYPQSEDLRSWLMSIPNHYVHFGDFDLAGINIFLTEFQHYLGDRSSYLIPSDIEAHLVHGSRERYNAQYQRFKDIASCNPDLQHLIDMIHLHHRCYDQEGYISTIRNNETMFRLF